MKSSAAFWLLAAGALLVGLLVWTPLPPGLWHDDGVYLMLGRSLARGGGLRYLGVPGDPPAPKFPPVYPAVAALGWWIGRDALGAASVASILNVLFTAGAVALLGAYAARALRLPLVIALGAAGLAALSVDLWRPALVALSEPLYLLVMVATLWAAARAEREDAPTRDVAALAALLLLLLHVRTAGVALFAAAVGGLALRRRWRAAGLVGAVVVVGMLPWAVWSARAGAALPGPLLDILGPYGPWLESQVRSAPDVYAASLPRAGAAMARRLSLMLVPGAWAPLWWATGALVSVAALAGTGLLGRRSPTAALALPFTLGLVWLWPFQDERMVLPALPVLLLALACSADALRRLACAAEPGVRARSVRVALAALALWAVAFGGSSAVRLSRGAASAPYPNRARQLVDAMNELHERVPPGSVVGAPELWATLSLVADVRVAPSALFHPISPTGDPVWGSPRSQMELWAATGVDYLVLEAGGHVTSPTLDLVDAACPGSVRLLESRAGASLVRLGWDEPCRRRLGVAGAR